MEVTDADALVPRPRRVWPLLAILLVCGVAGAAALVLWPDEPDVLRVMVAGTECEAGCAEARAELVEGLRELGWDVAAPAAVTRDGAREAAREVGAAQVVWLELEWVERRAPRGEDAYAHLRATASLLDVQTGAAIPIGSHERAAFGLGAAAAAQLAGERAAAGLVDAVAVAVAEHPSVRAYANDPSTDDPVRQADLRVLIDRAAQARRGNRYHETRCQAATRRLLGRASGPQVNCLCDGCAEEYVFGVAPDGSAAYVVVETRRAQARADDIGLRRIETVERIDRVPLDSSARTTLATTNNFYSYPAISGDGRRLAFVEEHATVFALVAQDVGTGARTPIWRDARRLQSPALSRDGSRVLFLARAPDERPILMVAPVAPGGEARPIAFAWGPRWVELAPSEGAPREVIAELVPLDHALEGPPDFDAPELAAQVVAFESPEGEERPIDGERSAWTKRLVLLDPETGAVLARLDDSAHRIDRLAGVRAGALYFTWHERDECGVGSWRPSTGERTFTVTQACLHHADVTERGSLVAAAPAARTDDPFTDDAELVEVDPSSGRFFVWTADSLRDRYPRAVPGGRRVVFDRMGGPTDSDLPSVATCWVELPAERAPVDGSEAAE